MVSKMGNVTSVIVLNLFLLYYIYRNSACLIYRGSRIFGFPGWEPIFNTDRTSPFCYCGVLDQMQSALLRFLHSLSSEFQNLLNRIYLSDLVSLKLAILGNFDV